MKINLKQLKKEGLAPEDIFDMVICDGFNIDEKCILVPEDSSAADELLDIIDEAIHGVWKRCDEVKKVTDNSFVSDVLMALEGEVTDILESINDDIEGVIKKYGLENVTQKNNRL